MDNEPRQQQKATELEKSVWDYMKRWKVYNSCGMEQLTCQFICVGNRRSETSRYLLCYEDIVTYCVIRFSVESGLG